MEIRRKPKKLDFSYWNLIDDPVINNYLTDKCADMLDYVLFAEAEDSSSADFKKGPEVSFPIMWVDYKDEKGNKTDGHCLRGDTPVYPSPDDIYVSFDFIGDAVDDVVLKYSLLECIDTAIDLNVVSGEIGEGYIDDRPPEGIQRLADYLREMADRLENPKAIDPDTFKGG